MFVASASHVVITGRVRGLGVAVVRHGLIKSYGIFAGLPDKLYTVEALVDPNLPCTRLIGHSQVSHSRLTEWSPS